MNRPQSDCDLYSDAVIVDPYPLYRELRDLGPAVFLSQHDAWAVSRFKDVCSALRADEVLVSSHGVALNDVVNGQPAVTTLTSDGDLHRRRRRVLMKPMMPRALTDVRQQIETLADQLVADLVARESFDGIADFAHPLPLSIVSHLVGLPEAGRQRMLDWAAASFNLLGTFNARGEAAVAPFMEMVEYASMVRRSGVRDGGWASLLYAAVDEGQLEESEPAGLLIDYIAPSLDTTILGAGHMLFELGRNSEQWELLRREPERIPAAVHESLRLEAPVRAFSRFTAADYDVGGTIVPKGERVLILYGSANRDERVFTDPDRFDITRDAKGHLSFGSGVHRCAGAHLAQLEMEALLRALVARVRTIDVSEPVPLMNNVLRGYESFRVTLR